MLDFFCDLPHLVLISLDAKAILDIILRTATGTYDQLIVVIIWSSSCCFEHFSFHAYRRSTSHHHLDGSTFFVRHLKYLPSIWLVFIVRNSSIGGRICLRILLTIDFLERIFNLDNYGQLLFLWLLYSLRGLIEGR